VTHIAGGSHPLDQQHIEQLQAAVKRLEFQLGEARQAIKGFEAVEEEISHHIPEHYEAGYTPLTD